VGPGERLGWTAIVSCLLGACLGLGLSYSAGCSADVAVAASVGLLAFLGTLGTAWSQSARDPSKDPRAASQPDSGDLKAVKDTFADRADESAHVRGLVRRSLEHAGGIRLVLVIHGMAGVGKTELAMHTAHELVKELGPHASRNGLTPLVRLVELRGHGELGRKDPAQALSTLLGGGADARLARMDQDDLAGEWRKSLRGRLLILLLDDPADEGQVLPFLAGDTSHVVLITSRESLPGLVAGGAEECVLEPLSADGVAQMVQNILKRPLGEGERRHVDQIARLSGGHPQAVEIAVRELARKDEAALGRRVAELEQNPKLLLGVEEYRKRGPVGNASVAAAFDLSYTQQSSDARLTLRRMATAPVPVLDAAAVAALTGFPRARAAVLLEELAKPALIQAVDAAPGRYQLHDLIRHYGRSLAERDNPAESRAAVGRLMAYYLDGAAQADAQLTRQPTPAAVERPVPAVRPELPALVSVMNWVRAELDNLLACADFVQREAKERGGREEDASVLLFASALAGILRNTGLWRQSIELQSRAVESAERLQAPLGIASALSERGMLRRLTSEYDLAIPDLERAVGIYQATGSLEGQAGAAHVLNTWGVVCDLQRSGDEGRRLLGESLEIFQRCNDSLGEANVLHDQGMAKLFAGNLDAASQLISQSLALFQAIGQPLGTAHAHNNLARVQQAMGANREAEINFGKAAELYGILGNKLGEVSALILLGTEQRRHDYRGAIRTLKSAVAQSEDTVSQSALVQALDALGDAYRDHGNRRSARDAWSRALRIARQHGMERDETMLKGRLESVRTSSARWPGDWWIGSLSRWKR
jgi:tetratricopeptide (TPR) repeat protein